MKLELKKLKLKKIKKFLMWISLLPKKSRQMQVVWALEKKEFLMAWLILILQRSMGFHLLLITKNPTGKTRLKISPVGR